MGRNKKITAFLYSTVIVFAAASCNVQKTNYVHLYVDQPDSLNRDASVSKLDSAATAEDVAAGYEPKQDFERDSINAPCCHGKSKDSLVQKEVLRALSEISHSGKRTHIKLDSIQNILRGHIDSVHSKQATQRVHPSDSQTVNKPDTVFIDRPIPATEETAPKEENEERQAKNDTILILKTQLKNSANTIYKTDTIYRERSIPASNETTNKQESVTSIRKEVTAKNDTIQRLKAQLNAKPMPPAKTDTVNAKRPFTVANITNLKEENTNTTSKELAAKNDTIQLLRVQLNANPKALSKTDTVYVERPLSAALDEAPVQENADALREELDAKTERITQLESQLKAQQKWVVPTNSGLSEEKSKNFLILGIDTFLLTAFYELGVAIPKNQVLDSLKGILKTKEVLRVELSGYTDSSGDPKFNKQLTRARLDFISSEISSGELKDKIYFQNFGESFASEKSIAEERKIEINIITKSQ